MKLGTKSVSDSDAILSGLESAFSENRATLIVGTGLSMSCSSNANGANWVGFLRQSIDWAIEHTQAGSTWKTTVEMVLSSALEEGDTNMLISAASLIANKIGELGAQGKHNWLTATIGALPLVDSSWARALDKLRCPILTTNYDTLIEQATGRSTASWTNTSNMQKVLARTSNDVGHLHGVWSESDSVVLSEADYTRVLHSAPLQALQQAASSVTSLVYVGVGDGLDDPNFSQLLGWHRQTFGASDVPHFRLCRDSELEGLKRVHGSDHITPVSYGSSWEDLPGFLEQFHEDDSAVLLRRNHVELARDILTARVRDLSIVCEKLDDLDERSLSQLVAPPVLLPLSNEQFQASKESQTEESSSSEQLERCDPREVAATQGITIVAGPEGSGRTTALYWLLEEASRTALGSAPVLVEFSELSRGGKPLTNALRNRVRETGAVLSKGAPLPKLIVGIDDVHPFSSRIVEQTIQELVGMSESGMPVFLSCKEGFEGELAKLLGSAGLQHVVRYVGELSRADIRDLVSLAKPSRSRAIEDNVVSILKQQHLPRTPFTVSLLISVLTAGHIVAPNSSHTTLLDLYLNQLIGRGDIAEDSRWGMDSDLRSAVLSDLAEFFIRSEAGSLAEADVVSRISSYFADRGIPESASDLLHNLRRRKVLSHETGRIFFSHSSYLFIFAAKAATKDKSFRDYLLSDPLLFAPVLKHYPSLDRSDIDLLTSLSKFFAIMDVGVMNSRSIHEPVKAIEAPEDIEERLQGIEKAFEAGELSDEDDEHAVEAPDDLEAFPRQRNEGSPLTLPDDLPDFHRYSTALDVVSTALRDSILIADPSLKREVLVQVLQGWAKLGSLFADSAELVEAVRKTIEKVAASFGASEERRERFVNVMTGYSPVMIIHGGMASSLSTTRLVPALAEAISDPDFANDPDAALGASVFLLDVQPQGWVKQLEYVSSKYKDTKVMARAFKLLCMVSYSIGSHSPDDQSRLRRYISDLESRLFTFKKEQLRQSFRASFEQNVLKRRQPGAIGK